MDKLLPANRAAEEYVLARCLQSAEDALAATSKLAADDFGYDNHKEIFRSILMCVGASEPVEEVSVGRRLPKGNQDPAYANLMKLQFDEAPYGALAHHCRIIKEDSIKRHFIRESEPLMAKAYNPTTDAEEFVQQLQDMGYKFRQAIESQLKDKDVFLPGEHADIAYELASNRADTPSEVPGIPTGMKTLDSIVHGLRDVTVITARSGFGKTALALNWAVNIGIIQRLPFLYLNYEMSVQDLSTRIMSILSDVPIDNIITGIYKDKTKEFKQVGVAADLMANSQLALSGNQPKDIYRTISLIQKWHKEIGIKVVVIDYIGEIGWDSIAKTEGGTYQTYGRFVRMIKDACVKLGVKAVILAQSNQQGAIADSQQIRHLADLVLQWGYDEVQGTSASGDMIIQQPFIFIDKNRHGRSFEKIPMYYKKPTQLIVEPTNDNAR